MNYKVCFDTTSCKVMCSKSKEVKLRGNRVRNVYLTFLDLPSSKLENYFLTSISQNIWL